MRGKIALGWLGVVVLLGTGFYGTYLLGQHQSKQVTWLSELVERTAGRQVYLVDGPIVCSNGKNLGKLQIDVNLRNGKVRVVRNDAGLDPDCTTTPAMLPVPPPVVPPASTTPPVEVPKTKPTAYWYPPKPKWVEDWYGRNSGAWVCPGDWELDTDFSSRTVSCVSAGTTNRQYHATFRPVG